VDYDSLKGIVPPHDTTTYAEGVGLMFDRSPGPGGAKNPAGPPNTVIDIGDVLGALAQAFVVNCS